MTIIQVPQDPPNRVITRYAFYKRFDDQELEDIELGSADNPAGTANERKKAAKLRRIMRTFDSVNFIDLDNPKVLNRLTWMETNGFLPSNRAAEIVNAGVRQRERTDDTF